MSLYIKKAKSFNSYLFRSVLTNKNLRNKESNSHASVPAEKLNSLFTNCQKAKRSSPETNLQVINFLKESRTVGDNDIPNIVTINTSDSSILYQSTKLVCIPYDDETKKCISEMKNAFFKLKSPYGLAANQMGFPLRIFLYYLPREAMQSRKDALEEVPLSILVNPVLTPSKEDGVSEDWESCFSVPGMQGKVIRYNTINYKGFDENGNPVQGIAKGFLARVMQHENDHLEGYVYIQKLAPRALYGTVDEMKIIEVSELSNFKLSKKC